MGLFSKKDKSSKSGSSSPAPSQTSSYAAPPPPYGAPLEEEPARNALFGNRNNNRYPDEKKSSNPYASAPAANPYGAPPSSYGGGGRGGGSGGYGEDTNRDALFGNRQQGGSQQRPSYGASGYGRPSGPVGGNGPTGGNSYGSTGPRSGGYGEPGYGEDRQLTAEEEEEEDVEAVKQQIRFTKQESVASTRNALKVAAQAEESGRATLERLGQQGESLYNTEKNLDIAHNKGQVANESAMELHRVNRSMFVPAWSNPMGKKSRQQEDEARILEEHQAQRDARDRARNGWSDGRKGINEGLNVKKKGPQFGETPDFSKYQIDFEEEDYALDKEIDSNLDLIGQAAGRLKALAIASGQETDRQNAKILELAKKSDAVDDRITVTHNRIKRIH